MVRGYQLLTGLRRNKPFTRKLTTIQPAQIRVRTVATFTG